jgi:hypothetical protein
MIEMPIRITVEFGEIEKEVFVFDYDPEHGKGICETVTQIQRRVIHHVAMRASCAWEIIKWQKSQ